MCTNRALVDSLECYMDELVDCFEDFVKKSVIAISVAVGLLVAMIAYVLKIIADRSHPASEREIETSERYGDLGRRSSQNYRNRGVLESNYMVYDKQDEKGTCTISAPCAKSHTDDEQILKDSGLSCCSKVSCCLSKSRLSIPSLDTICRKSGSTPKLSKKTLKSSGKIGSCCSLCCNEKCER